MNKNVKDVIFSILIFLFSVIYVPVCFPNVMYVVCWFMLPVLLPIGWRSLCSSPEGSVPVPSGEPRVRSPT